MLSGIRPEHSDLLPRKASQISYAILDNHGAKREILIHRHSFSPPSRHPLSPGRTLSRPRYLLDPQLKSENQRIPSSRSSILEQHLGNKRVPSRRRSKWLFRGDARDARIENPVHRAAQSVTKKRVCRLKRTPAPILSPGTSRRPRRRRRRRRSTPIREELRRRSPLSPSSPLFTLVSLSLSLSLPLFPPTPPSILVLSTKRFSLSVSSDRDVDALDFTESRR